MTELKGFKECLNERTIFLSRGVSAECALIGNHTYIEIAKLQMAMRLPASAVAALFDENA